MLLAIADFANASGVAFPSVSTLAHMTRTDARHVRRRLKVLVDDGDLAIFYRAHRTSFYIVRTGQDENEFNTAISAIASATGTSENEIRASIAAQNVTPGKIASPPWQNCQPPPGKIAPRSTN